MASLLGYLASILLGISLLVNNDFKFRWLNTLGCLSFILYGIMIDAFPIILTNTALFLINIFYLVKIYRTKEAFDLLEFKSQDKIVEKFLAFYHTDIKSYFPSYYHKIGSDDISFVVLRDMVIANIFVANILPDGSAIVKINYTVPKYRDYKVGKFIFDQEKKYLLSKGINKIMYEKVENNQHNHFLKKMGFEPEIVDRVQGMVKRLV